MADCTPRADFESMDREVVHSEVTLATCCRAICKLGLKICSYSRGTSSTPLLLLQSSLSWQSWGQPETL